MTTRRIFSTVGLLATFGFLTTQAVDATAASTAVIKIAAGKGGQPVNGNKKKNAGPGSEQGVVAVTTQGGRTILTQVWMSSDIPNQNPNDNVNQCKCAAVELTSAGPKMLTQDAVTLTNNRGDRPCNHPKVAADNQGNIIWTYAANKNNGTNVKVYAGVLDAATCSVTTPDKLVSTNGNGNDGAMGISYIGNGYTSIGYNNNGDNAHAIGLQLQADKSLKVLYDNEVISPSNIPRPSIVPTGNGTEALYCATAGNNRPPEIGVQCLSLDAATGKVNWKATVVPSNPNQKMYANQPTVTKVADGKYILGVQFSNGGGKNDNNKGSNTTHLYLMDTSTAGSGGAKPTMLHEISGVTGFQTHSSLCGGSYGPTGETVAMVMGAPQAGNGGPIAQMIHVAKSTTASGSSPLQLVTDASADKWSVGFYADSGLLSNIYGQNPGQQGRNFMSCIGDVPNPGYHVQNGWMADVQTFFAMPHEGRVPGDYKLAEWVSLIPAKADAALPPEGPKDPSDIPPGNVAPGTTPPAANNPNPPAANNPATPSNPAVNQGTSGNTGSTDNTGDGLPPTQSSQGCACSVPTTSGAGNTAGGVALLGLGLIFVSRRRRNNEA